MNMTEHAIKIKQMEQAGQDTTDELEALYFDNLAFVRQIARPYEGRQEPEDLLQEGFLSLIRAMAYYEPDKGAAFTSIWGLYLKTDFSRMNDSRPHIPHYIRDDVRKYQKLEREYIIAHGEAPPPSFWGQHFTPQKLEAVKLAILQNNLTYLDAPAPAEDGGTIGELIPDATADSVEDIATDGIAAEQLRRIWDDVEQVTTPEQAAALKSVYMDGTKTQETPELNRQYKSGLARLQKNRARFAPFLELSKSNYAYNEGVKHCGVAAFYNDGMSATERAALRMIDREKLLEQEAARLMEELKNGLCFDMEYQRKKRQERQERRERMKK